MRTKLQFTTGLAALIVGGMLLILPACALAKSPRMQMTTDVPDSITTPDEINTRLGTLRFVDGFPTDETAEKIYEQLYFQRAIEAMVQTTQAASLSAFREAIRLWGPDNKTMMYWDGRMDSKVLLLTPNTTVAYAFMWIDLKAGPLVMETPPKVLGLIDSFWFQYVTDFGNAGADRGKGGKYLLLPPDYEGDVPEGYHVRRSSTYGNWVIMRGFMKDFDATPVIANMKNYFRLYPLGEQPSEVDWVDVKGKPLNTIHASDATFYEEVNKVVQEEQSAAANPELLGLLASIGIEKGKPFNPTGRQLRTLNEAAAVGTAALRSIVYQNRQSDYAAFPGSKSWETGFPGGSHEFLRSGVRALDQRVRFFYYATGVTPAMVKPPVGKGGQYCMGLRDSDGHPLDGSRIYKLHVPPDVPAVNFWDITIYDVQTRSLLQTDYPYPSVTSVDESIVRNADGSYDIIFGPEQPAGKVNWIQTIPGKGWHALWRIYGPTQAWYDKTWSVGDFELVE
jgi:hypothetical protein